MADSTTSVSVRMSDETQKRFKELAELSGLRNQNEFMAYMLSLYKAQEISDRVPRLDSAISTVKELSDRLINVLNGVGDAVITKEENLNTKLREIDARILEIKQEADEKIELAESDKQEVIDQNMELRIQISNKVKELEESGERERTLKDQLSDKSVLISKHLKEIDLLQSEISEQAAIVSEAEAMRTEVERLRELSKEQALKIEQLEVGRERALVDLEARLRQEITDYQSRVLDNIKTLEEKEKAYDFGTSELTQTIENLRNDIVKLQEELEEAKKPKPRKPATPRKPPSAKATEE